MTYSERVLRLLSLSTTSLWPVLTSEEMDTFDPTEPDFGFEWELAESPEIVIPPGQFCLVPVGPFERSGQFSQDWSLVSCGLTVYFCEPPKDFDDGGIWICICNLGPARVKLKTGTVLAHLTTTNIGDAR